MPLSLSDLFAMSDDRRRRIFSRLKHRGKYTGEKVPRRSKEELLAWLKEKDIRSSRQVDKVRKPGDPTLSNFRREFPKWQDAIDQAFGFHDLPPNVDDPEYMAKVVTQFGLWTLADYKRARKARPDVIPSYFALMKRWGGFRGLKIISVRYSLLATMNSYVSLRRRYGRIPTFQECLQANVILDKAIEFYGSKRKLDLFLDGMEKK